ncbi:MAG: GGDEF domain-containing protein [Pseudomonadota bacterium]
MTKLETFNPASHLRDSGLMPSAPGYEAAMSIATKSFELIQRFQAPPIPKVYEICYAYAGGQPPQVVERVDAAVAAHGTLALHEVYQIHSDFFSYPEQMQARQNQTTDELDSELSAMLSMIGAHLDSTNTYSGSLDTAATALSGDTSKDKLLKTIEYLVAANNTARQETQRLTVSLEASQASLTNMRDKLDKAREAGLRDALTNLRNRRHFDHALPEEIGAAKENETQLCLVLIDVDHFKRFNDSFGHPAGDAVLRLMGALLAESVKGRDTAVRYGGEEFAIILPDTGLSGAITLAERMRVQLQRKELILRDTRQSLGKVTASFGLAEMCRGESAESLLARADEAMYEAKRSGRNRVIADES